MTLLTLINEAQDSVSLPRSSNAISSTGPERPSDDIAGEPRGQSIVPAVQMGKPDHRKDVHHIAATEQTNAVPTDFDHYVVGSFFNRTQFRRVTGPLNAEEWQAQQALSASLLFDAFRFVQSDIQIVPTPEAGDTYAYEYMSKNWCKSSGGTGQAAWADDQDVGVLDETLMTLGLVWRFKNARGLPYAEEFSEYEQQVEQAIMRDGGRRGPNYSHDDSLYDHAQGPLVMEGNWNL